MAIQNMSSAVNINDFPDEILCHIISFLPINDAVRTSILSRRWSYLFTLISNLNIEFNENELRKVMRFISVVDRVLFLSRKPCIKRFRLKCYQVLDPWCIDGWIHALMSHMVQELDLSIEAKQFYGLPLPMSLFSCKSLMILKLDLPLQSCDFKVPTEACLPNLKVFHLKGFVFSDDESSDRLFSSCPTLEDLALQWCYLRVGCHKFSVSNPSLKRLTITSVVTDFLLEQKVELVINAPRLVYVEHSSSNFHSHQFVDVQLLAEAVVYLAVATDLFNGLKNVQSLQISSDSLLILACHRVPLPPFGKLTELKIVGGEFHTIGLCHFLMHCYQLETLIFQKISDEWGPRTWALAAHLLASFWNHVKEIKILSFGGEEAHMKLVQYFLNNALVLEKLTIHITGGEQHSKNDLLSLPRASKECQVVIL
ncbi:hypothetical protein SLE2022_079130 [Rubroshorea leprosula]